MNSQGKFSSADLEKPVLSLFQKLNFSLVCLFLKGIAFQGITIGSQFQYLLGLDISSIFIQMVKPCLLVKIGNCPRKALVSIHTFPTLIFSFFLVFRPWRSSLQSYKVSYPFKRIGFCSSSNQNVQNIWCFIVGRAFSLFGFPFIDNRISQSFFFLNLVYHIFLNVLHLSKIYIENRRKLQITC